MIFKLSDLIQVIDGLGRLQIESQGLLRLVTLKRVDHLSQVLEDLGLRGLHLRSRFDSNLSICVYICLLFDLLLFLLLRRVAQEYRKSNQGKHKGWVRVLLSILATLGKDLLEPN